MTLKKQFILLSYSIVAIPLICCIFIFTLFNFKSSRRYILRCSEKLDLLPSEDAESIKKIIKQLPSDIQLIVFSSEQNKVFYSTIPEITTEEQYTRSSIWQIINQTSDNYFYQFSSPPKKRKSLLIITRIPKIEQNHQINHKLFYIVFSMLLFLTIINLILIAIISKTIFTSIVKIENKTKQIADGNLNDEVLDKNIKNKNEITSILESLEKMRIELMEAQERKNKFIMGISHDLRTPVAVVKGYSEAIIDGVITGEDEIKNTVSLIGAKTTQLGDMIDTLINFMKLNNDTKVTLISQSITDIINDFANYAEVTGTLFKRKILTDIKLNENISIPLDVQLVHRSFENLFSNALRYTDENDSIYIISYIEQSKSPAVILKIKDTGIGIDKKDLNSIFDMFFRGTNSRLEEGMGIGLSIVKTIIDTHGWKIDVDSKKNEGTCFTITIPIKKN